MAPIHHYDTLKITPEAIEALKNNPPKPPPIKWFEEERAKDKQIRELQARVEHLERKLDLIFGDHYLVNGQWVQIK